MARSTTITGEGIRDETVESADIASGSIKAGELSAQAISGQGLITEPHAANDRLLIWDATDSSLKQVASTNLFVESGTAVGIGTGTDGPDNTLHVKSPGTTHIKIESEAGYEAAVKMNAGSSSTYMWTPGNTSDIRFYAGGADRMHIDNDGNVGVGTTTPATTLAVAGSLSLNVTGINANNDPGTTYTIADADYVILANTRPTAQGGIDSALTITLPLAASYPGRIIIVKDAAGYANINNITIERAGSDTIEGVATSITLNSVAQKTTLISNGASNWCEIGN
jgi:hypothetical protein